MKSSFDKARRCLSHIRVAWQAAGLRGAVSVLRDRYLVRLLGIGAQRLNIVTRFTGYFELLFKLTYRFRLTLQAGLRPVAAGPFVLFAHPDGLSASDGDRVRDLPRTVPSSPDDRRVWAIGVYSGQAPLTVAQPHELTNPVVTHQDVSDVPARYVADPFMLRSNGVWHMFFEVMNDESRKGEIGLATSRNGMDWNYERIVLAEPYHLSYPYVFVWNGGYYMIPEMHRARAIRLYKAMKFPTEWVFVNTLVRGLPFSDASIFRHRERWWILTETSANYRHDTLRLYFARNLHGPWVEHPSSPVVTEDSARARPAGRVLVRGNRVIRFAQDCSVTYGFRVRAYEIIVLSATEYRERPAMDEPVLTGSSHGWNAGGMHHIDVHGVEDRWMACVDGWMIPNEHSA